MVSLISQTENLVFEGIQAYAGHISHETKTEERKKFIINLEQKLVNLKLFLEDKGFKVNEISGGSTGTSLIKNKSRIYTELQAGSYIMMDSSYNKMDLGFKNALFVLSTIISKRKNKVITDVGIKGCSTDQGFPELYGLNKPAKGTNKSELCNFTESYGLQNATLQLHEEHTLIDLEDNHFNLKDKLLYMPSHCCTTVNLYDYIHLIRKGHIEDRVPIVSRGKYI